MLHPATALAPLVTPAANAIPDPIEAKPSPSSESMPAKTAQPPAQKIQPARNTGVSKPPYDPKTQNGGEIKPEVASNPGTLKGDSSSIDPKVGSGATGGTMNSPSQNEAGNPVAKLTPPVQSAAGVGENKNSGPDSATMHSPKENGDFSSVNDPASDVVGPGTNDIEQSRPIATAGGEPIIAISQHTPSEEHETGDPGVNGGESQNNPNDNTVDEPHAQKSDHLGDPEMNDPHSGIATASQAYTNNDLGMKPTPFITTIGSHVVQALSSPGTVLVDGESITLGLGSKVVSGTPIVLQQDGGLVIGTSTIKNLLPNPLPTPNALFTVSNEILETNQNSPNTNSYPTSPPQVYRVGSVNVTAGGPPITYSGTKIQAFNGGSIVVGDSTYHATPTPAAVKAVGGAQDSGISNPSAGNTNSSSGNVKANGLTGSETGGPLNASTRGIMPYQGSATRGRVGWTLLCGSVIPFIGQLRL